MNPFHCDNLRDFIQHINISANLKKESLCEKNPQNMPKIHNRVGTTNCLKHIRKVILLGDAGDVWISGLRKRL